MTKKSTWLEEYAIFSGLVKAKDCDELLLFAKYQPHYKERVIRAIIEMGTVDDINRLIKSDLNPDYAHVLSCIEFFRKKDVAFLHECAERLIYISPDEGDWLLLGTR